MRESSENPLEKEKISEKARLKNLAGRMALDLQALESAASYVPAEHAAALFELLDKARVFVEEAKRKEDCRFLTKSLVDYHDYYLKSLRDLTEKKERLHAQSLEIQRLVADAYVALEQIINTAKAEADSKKLLSLEKQEMDWDKIPTPRTFFNLEAFITRMEQKSKARIAQEGQVVLVSILNNFQPTSRALSNKVSDFRGLNDEVVGQINRIEVSVRGEERHDSNCLEKIRKLKILGGKIPTELEEWVGQIEAGEDPIKKMLR